MHARTRPRTYIVEAFEGSTDVRAVAQARDRLRAACADLGATGRTVEYLGLLFVPQDELILHLFISTGPEGVRDVSRRAAIRVERIVESLAVGMPADGTLVVPSLAGCAPAAGWPTRRG
jgi:hypothetical protein